MRVWAGKRALPEIRHKNKRQQCLIKLKKLLNKYGSDRSQLLTATIFLKDMTLFS